MPFENPSGLWGLAALLPLILLYLIRPKPTVMAIPSLMFFMRSSGRNKLTSFLKQFIRDLLFLLQLLTLLALILTLAKPFTTYTHDVTAQNTVIVLDVSASSQVQEGTRTRFNIGLDKATDVLGSKNTIILAKDVPLIGIKDATYQEARDYLTNLNPLDTTTRLGEAIILAGETLTNSEGRVVVISDFINTGGQDPDIAKAVLESRSIIVDFINTQQGPRKNIGIVDLNIDEDQTTIYIKNYDKTERTIPLIVGNTRKELNLPAGGMESYSFQTPQGVTKASIQTPDDFPLDNDIIISAPEKKTIRILLITNNASVFLKNALLSSTIAEVTVAEPPIVPTERYDVYVIHNIKQEQLLPGTLEDIASKVKDGATVIIHAQEDSDIIDYKNLLPLRFMGRLDTGKIRIDQLNRFTKNIDFGTLNYFFLVQKTTPFLTITSADNSTIIGIGKLGNGKTTYVGILEKSSDFKFSPGYPIFWTELLKYLTDQQDIRTLNYKTGDALIFDNPQRIQTPSKVVKQTTYVLDEAGTYLVDNKKIAVNLVNEHESAINKETSIGTKTTDFELKPVTEQRTYSFATHLITAALIIFLLELIYIKRRGDL